MRITIITRYYHPTPDGIAHHSAYLYQYLTQMGHVVQIIYDDGILSLAPAETNILVNKIKRQKSDWVIFQYNGYSYNRFGAPSWLSTLYKKITSTDTKLCIIVHETFIRKETNIKLKIYRFLQKRALKAATKYAHLTLTTTQLYQTQLSNLNRRSHVFFTPSNFENYIHELDSLKKSDGNLVLGTFGNRNPEFLLNVLQQLEDKLLKCSFYFIGNYQPKYVKLIKDYSKKFKNIQIYRSGKLTDKNIVQYLQKLNAFILLEAVRSDGGGGLNTKSGSSATALCMGIPLLSTKGDFTDSNVFRENENYILLDHKNYIKTAEIIYKSVQNLDILNEIGNNGRKIYESDFSWKQYVSKMLTLMN